jgi:hypothetical protein
LLLLAQAIHPRTYQKRSQRTLLLPIRSKTIPDTEGADVVVEPDVEELTAELADLESLDEELDFSDLDNLDEELNFG